MKWKTFFIVFKGLSFVEKNKNLIKIADSSFKNNIIWKPAQNFHMTISIKTFELFDCA